MIKNCSILELQLQRDVQNTLPKNLEKNNFVYLGVIGQGSFSQVHKVRRVEDGKIYALKKIKLGSLKPKQVEYAISEIKILAALSCQFVISFRQALYDQRMQQLSIVMEWANEGDLQSDIEKRLRALQILKSQLQKNGIFSHQIQRQITKYYIPESQIWRAIRDILSGLSVLHKSFILHRDIKTANIFKSEGVYKLGDLNIAKICPGLAYAYTQTGTPYYASPEVWKQLPYNSKSDIWSFGCVIYEMCELTPPFMASDMNMLYDVIVKGKYKKINCGFYSRQLSDLVDICLNVDPKQRKNCQQIMSLSWVNNKFKQYNIKQKQIILSQIRRQEHFQKQSQRNLSCKLIDQIYNKQLCIKLTKQLRQLRSITEPCNNSSIISCLKEKNLNKILPNSNYPSNKKQFKNNTQYYASINKNVNLKDNSLISQQRQKEKQHYQLNQKHTIKKINQYPKQTNQFITQKLRSQQKENRVKVQILSQIPLSESFDLQMNYDKQNNNKGIQKFSRVVQEKNCSIVEQRYNNCKKQEQSNKQYQRKNIIKEKQFIDNQKNYSCGQNKINLYSTQKMKNDLNKIYQMKNTQSQQKMKSKKRVLIIPCKSAKITRYNNKYLNSIQYNDSKHQLSNFFEKDQIIKKTENTKEILRQRIQKNYKKLLQNNSQQKKILNLCSNQQKKCDQIQISDNQRGIKCKYKYKYKYKFQRAKSHNHISNININLNSIQRHRQKNLGKSFERNNYEKLKMRPISVEMQRNNRRNEYSLRSELDPRSLVNPIKKSYRQRQNKNTCGTSLQIQKRQHKYQRQYKYFDGQGEKKLCITNLNQKKSPQFSQKNRYEGVLNRGKKKQNIESVHQLPRIKQILIQRGSNIRQQIGRIYYNSNNFIKSNTSSSNCILK